MRGRSARLSHIQKRAHTLSVIRTGTFPNARLRKSSSLPCSKERAKIRLTFAADLEGRIGQARIKPYRGIVSEKKFLALYEGDFSFFRS